PPPGEQPLAVPAEPTQLHGSALAVAQQASHPAGIDVDHGDVPAVVVQHGSLAVGGEHRLGDGPVLPEGETQPWQPALPVAGQPPPYQPLALGRELAPGQRLGVPQEGPEHVPPLLQLRPALVAQPQGELADLLGALPRTLRLLVGPAALLPLL